MSGRFSLHRDLGGTTWWWHNLDCRQAYIAIVRSIPEYAAAAWVPWLPSTLTSKLNKVQLIAARAITGLVRTTPVESQQLPISTRFYATSLLIADEWAHLSQADDRR